MSFEGYYENLCEKGHLSSEDVYWTDDGTDCCPFCNSPIVFRHLVDQTNGMDENIPDTCPYPFEEIEPEDWWQVDHYGNKYATRRTRYKIPEFEPK